MMNFKLKLSVTESKLLEILAYFGGTAQTVEIVKELQRTKSKISKQAVYRSLSSLKKKEIITINKRVTAINTHWVIFWRKMLDQLESATIQKEIPNKLAFTFSSVWSAAPTLVSYVNVLIAQSDKKVPIIFINPHQWFYAARTWSEEQLVDSIEKNGYTLWQGIGHVSQIDRGLLSTKFRNRPNVLGSFVTPFKNEKNLYVCVIGDYVIETKMEENFHRALDKWYASTSEITEVSRGDIQNILKMSTKVKIKISKNTNRAKSYRTHMKKFFG